MNGSKEAQVIRNAAAAKPRELFDLTDALIGNPPDAVSSKALRVYFDLHATEMIEAHKLKKDQWEVLVRFDDDGGPGEKIKKKASAELKDNGGDDAKWEKERFDKFKEDWKGICDGYTKPEKWCPPHPGGANCPDPQLSPSAAESMMYAYPKPEIRTKIEGPFGGGKYEVRGEGILKGAAVEEYDNKQASGTPVAIYTNGWRGTFRCSTFEFTPADLKPGTYYVLVRNQIGAEKATEPINATPVEFVLKAHKR
jgi:hypothetical protein